MLHDAIQWKQLTEKRKVGLKLTWSFQYEPQQLKFMGKKFPKASLNPHL